MKRSAALVCLIVFLALGYSNSCLAVPALPDVSHVTQPDGNVVKVVLLGDEWNNSVETLEGYTITQGEDRFWHYVSHYVGSKPVLDPAYAHEQPPAQIEKHVHPREEVIEFSPKRKNLAAALNAAPLGEFSGKILFILAKFSDRSGTYTESDFSTSITGEIRDYFQKASYAKVNLSPARESFGTSNNGVVGWLNLGYPHPNTGENTDVRNKEITKKAILKADRYVDFKSFDANGDGYVDADELAVVVIVAGYERAYSAEYSPSVWGHKWDLDEIGAPSVDGVTVCANHGGAGGYAQFGEIHQELPLLRHKATMGIMVHELGHLIFGLPDLYDNTPQRNPSSSGVGAFCLMGYCSWGKSSTLKYAGQKPVLPSAWVKYKLRWSSGAAVTSGVRSITAAGSTSAGSRNTVYRCPTAVPKEYFLIENRQPLGYDLGLRNWLGGQFGGIAIWHVDERILNNDDDSHRMVDLEEADGSIMGTGKGQKTDLWYSGNHTTFNNITNPNSRLYSSALSDISITDISASGSVMTASMVRCPKLKLGYPPLEGNINAAGDSDWYYFSVGSGTYIIETLGGTLNDTYMYLYGPNSQTMQLEEDDDDGEGLAAKITRYLTPGTYYVKVRAYSASGTGSYSIRLLRPNAAALQSYSMPNPVPAYDGSSPCFSYSPEWHYYIYLKELNGGEVTITQFTGDYYDANGYWINQSIYGPDTFASWFSSCGPGSTRIGPEATVCASICTHLGGRTSGSEIWTFYGVDALNNSVSTSFRVWFNQPSGSPGVEEIRIDKASTVEPESSQR